MFNNFAWRAIQRMGAAVHCADRALRDTACGAARGDPLAFLAIPIVDMVPFATFATAALVLRRNKGMHKRLMLAYISFIIAAVARLPGVPHGAASLFWRGIFVGGIGRDLRSRVATPSAHCLSLGASVPSLSGLTPAPPGGWVIACGCRSARTLGAWMAWKAPHVCPAEEQCDVASQSGGRGMQFNAEQSLCCRSLRGRLLATLS